jgi:hypothetical protein
MITEPISYSGSSKKLVEKFNSKRKKNSTYWDSEEVAALKKEIKDYYKKKQNYTCSYCNQRIKVRHNASWDTEHVVPRKSHPQFMFEPKNLCIACKDCNTEKGDVNVLKNRLRKTYPDKSSDFLIMHPHFDEYREHIWILLENIYIARSKKGRYTIEKCGLLRFALEKLNWAGILARKPELIEIYSEAHSSIDEAIQDHLLLQMLAIAEIKVTVSLQQKLERGAASARTRSSKRSIK